MSDTLEAATALANQMERLFEGQETAAVLYAIGMVIAHAAAAYERAPEETANLVGKVARDEYARQFRSH